MWDDKGVADCRLSVGSVIILTYYTAEYVNIHYIINVVRISLCKPKLTMNWEAFIFACLRTIYGHKNTIWCTFHDTTSVIPLV